MKIREIEKLNCEVCPLFDMCRIPGKPSKGLFLCSDPRIQDVNVEAYRSGFTTNIIGTAAEEFKRTYLEQIVEKCGKNRNM